MYIISLLEIRIRGLYMYVGISTVQLHRHHSWIKRVTEESCQHQSDAESMVSANQKKNAERKNSNKGIEVRR